MTNRGWNFRRGRILAAVALLAAALTAGPVGAVTLLDDFESGFAGMTGTLSASGPVAVLPRPNTQAGMRISTVGEGACNALVGNSRALCGADTLQWAGFDGALLSYDLTFGSFARIAFDLAAWSERDPFDPIRGDRPDEWGDYVRVRVFAEGAWWLLAEFTGTRLRGFEQGLMSSDAGLLLGAGQAVGAEFRTFRLSGLLADFTGTGQLVFEIRSTGSAEQIGLDNLRLLPIPLPASLPLALLGVAALGMVRGRQRRLAALGG
jgi:hypothetical protein